MKSDAEIKQILLDPNHSEFPETKNELFANCYKYIQKNLTTYPANHRELIEDEAINELINFIKEPNIKMSSFTPECGSLIPYVLSKTFLKARILSSKKHLILEDDKTLRLHIDQAETNHSKPISNSRYAHLPTELTHPGRFIEKKPNNPNFKCSNTHLIGAVYLHLKIDWGIPHHQAIETQCKAYNEVLWQSIPKTMVNTWETEIEPKITQHIESSTTQTADAKNHLRKIATKEKLYIKNFNVSYSQNIVPNSPDEKHLHDEITEHYRLKNEHNTHSIENQKKADHIKEKFIREPIDRPFLCTIFSWLPNTTDQNVLRYFENIGSIFVAQPPMENF